jgi:GDPmannose 4,6-dehydratase
MDPRFKRPAEVPNLKGKADKAKKVLGWKPKTSFKDLVKMMVEADIKKYENKK